MITICAWCEDKGVRTVLGESDKGEGISHGICTQCEAELIKEMEEEVDDETEGVGSVASDGILA